MSIGAGASNTQIVGNVVSGNGGAAIRIQDTHTANTTIRANRIGTNASGLAARPNAGGVVASGGQAGTVIGGPNPEDGNLISGNLIDGVAVSYFQERSVQTWLRADGDTAESSAYRFFHAPTVSTIGTIAYEQGRYGEAFSFTSGVGRLESSGGVLGTTNAGATFWFKSSGTPANSVVLKMNAANASGFAYQLRIGADGRMVLESSNGTVTQTTPASANSLLDGQWHFIVASTRNNAIHGGLRLYVDGVPTGAGIPITSISPANKLIVAPNFTGAIDDLMIHYSMPSVAELDAMRVAGQSPTVIQNNRIGTNAGGNRSLPNSGNGISISDEIQSNILSNTIAGNSGSGIRLSHYATGITVRGNYVGTNHLDSKDLGNADGIVLTDRAHDISIGGTGIENRNVISGNRGNGIVISSPGTLRNSIVGNSIGTNLAGTMALGNKTNGVLIASGAAGNTILGNTISGNATSGITIRNSTTQNNTIAGNRIGTDSDGAYAIGNGLGIQIDAAANNTVGGLLPIDRNLISGNLGDGLLLSNGAEVNTVIGNWFGVDRFAQFAIGNALNAVHLLGSSTTSNSIGGGALAAGNLLAFSGQSALRLEDNTSSTSSRNIYSNNSFRGNLGLAIDVGASGPTFNDGLDGFSDLREYPVLTNAEIDLANPTDPRLILKGFAQPFRRMDLYVSSPTANGRGQGITLIQSFIEGVSDLDAAIRFYDPITYQSFANSQPGSIQANAFEFNIPLPAGVSFGTLLSAVSIGSISEFGNVLPAGLTVADAANNLAPIVSLGSNKTLVTGEGFQMSGKFTDDDSKLWQITVDYGDGSPVKSIEYDPVTRAFELDHVYSRSQANPYLVTVRVLDNGGRQGVGTTLVEVVNERPVLTFNQFTLTPIINEGNQVELHGLFVDSGIGDQHTVSIDWGDGTTSTSGVDMPAIQPGDRSFTAFHTYLDDGVFNTRQDTYKVVVSVTDGSGSDATAPGLFLQEVVNVLPYNLVAYLPPEVSENSPVFLEVFFEDAGINDSHEVMIDWGDGSPKERLQVLPNGSLFRTFQLEHTFADNSDRADSTYEIVIEVADDDEPLSPTVLRKTIKVVNELPSIMDIVIDRASIDENGMVTLSVQISDSGELDSHQLVIDWGDNSAETILDLPAGVTTVDEIAHVYRDDPNGLIPIHLIQVKVRDKDMSTTSFETGTLEVAVNNVAPELIGPLRLYTRDADDRNWIEYSSGGVLSISEGQRIRLVGSYFDQGPDDVPLVRVTWSNGRTTEAVVDPGSRTFEAEFRYTDDYAFGTPLDVEQITVVADDGDGGVSTPQYVEVAVQNTAPKASFLPGIVTNSLHIPLVAFVEDPGQDQFTYLWTVSSGALTQTRITTSPNFLLERTGHENDPMIVELAVIDDDTHSSTAYRASFVFGSGQDDLIQISDADFPANIDKLFVLGLAGSDTIDATHVSAEHTVIFVGGADNDHYYGGSGNDIFVLQGGDDDVNVTRAGFTPNENGDDRFVLKVNSTFTIFDFVGNNILDFSLTGFGVEFDLSRTRNQSADYQIVAPGHSVAAQGKFTELDGTDFGDRLTGQGGATVRGGAGDDHFFTPTGFTESKMRFLGGNDADLLTIGAQSIVGEISFEGDQGADVFDVVGSVSTVDFGGGADIDVLTIASTAIVGSISFEGDVGADLFTVLGEVSNVDFSGGADNDLLTVGLAGSVGEISFEGDLGADDMVVEGSVIEVYFGGGADIDLLTVASEGTVGEISFEGDQGRDELRVYGRVQGDPRLYVNDNPTVPNTDDGRDYAIYFLGGADVDLLSIGADAVVSTISFEGDLGADQLKIEGSVDQVDFSGGADSDLFVLAESATVASISFEGDFGADALTLAGTVLEVDFSGGADADLLTIAATGIVNEISFEGDSEQTSGRDRFVILGTVTGEAETDNPLIPNDANGRDYSVYFRGGLDTDLLQVGADSVVASIDFEGDVGADEFTILGSVSEVDFSGGADNDLLQVLIGSSVSEVSFEGDTGADIFTILGSVNEVDFSGGSDSDILSVGVSGIVNEVSFEGDTGFTESEEAVRPQRDRLMIAGVIRGDNNPERDNPNIPNSPISNTDYSVYFRGGADADVLMILPESAVNSISFEGDVGADLFAIAGVVGEVDFSGGADADVLTISAGTVGEVSFEGDSGADIFDIFGGVIGNVDFSGGADSDRFRNSASGVASIRFLGFGADPNAVDRDQDGDDLFLSRGSNIGELYFQGDIGSDVFQVLGNNIDEVSFEGDLGADVFIINGAYIDSIDFSGGADADTLSVAGSEIGRIAFEGDASDDPDANDTFINRSSASSQGAVNTITFVGRDGSDAFRNDGAGWDQVVFIGGSDNDVFQNNGALISEINFEGDEGADIFENNGNYVAGLVFSGGSGSNVFVNDGDNVSNAFFFGGDQSDFFLNTGSLVNVITVEGNDGSDLFSNLGVSVENVVFEGDDGDDQFINSGAKLGNIEFWGGAGRDTLVNRASGKNSSGLHFWSGSRSVGGALASLPYLGTPPIFIAVDSPSLPDDSDDTFLNYASHVDDLFFEGDVGADIFQNFGTEVSVVGFDAGPGDDQALNQGSYLAEFSMFGADGDDVFENRGPGSADLEFEGGSGNDSFIQLANSVVAKSRAYAASFSGDAGVDVLANYGSNVSGLYFIGGTENDRFLNSGDNVGLLTFRGDAGNDALQNNGNSINTIQMDGGNDEDSLFNNGSVIQRIDFDGGNGANTLINTGNRIGVAGKLPTEPNGIMFRGGDKSDLLRVQGTNIARVHFVAGDGDDALLYNAKGSDVQFMGGRGDDVFSYRGVASHIEYSGDEGNDRSIFAGPMTDVAVATTLLDGGVGDDRYEFVGTPSGFVRVIENFTGSADSSQDTIDFSSFTSGGVSLDLASLASQTQPGDLTVQLSNSMGVEQLVGTSGNDSLLGNDRDNYISGADYFQTISNSTPIPQRSETQWVLLDFDTYTEPSVGEHVYTASERVEIQRRIEGVYYGYEPDVNGGMKPRSFESPNRWFNIRFTTNVHEIEAAEVSEYVTIKFNQTSSFGRPGGKASEIDLGNENFGGFADVQVNGLLGGIEVPVAASEDFTEQLPEDAEQAVGQEKPAATSANFVALSAKIAAHELGHLLGLRHYDAFGPIGFGIHSPPGVAEFKPQYQGTSAAFETFDHIIGSPASVGSTRANDVGQLFFGEREAVKIAAAMADPSQISFQENELATALVQVGQVNVHARSLELATLQVANTLGKGLNSTKNFLVHAATVNGSIELQNGRSESDYFQFAGRAGDLVTIEIASAALERFTSQGSSGFIDSIVRLRDANGNLVQTFSAEAVNDDEFESSDSVLMDIRLPSSGLYTIEVDTFFRSPVDNNYQDLVEAIDRLQGIEERTLEQQELLTRLLETMDDRDVGRYQLFIYSFATASAGDGFNSLRGRGGIDSIVGSTNDDYRLTLSALPNGVQAKVGDTFRTLIDFADQAADSWIVTIDYGDDSVVTLSELTPSTGIPIEHAYAHGGLFEIAITITNDDGQVVHGLFKINVTGGNVVPTASIHATPSTIIEGASSVVSLQPDPGFVGNALHYYFSMNSNDRDAATFLTSSPASYQLFKFDDNGTYVVYARVMDASGGFSDYETTIAVQNSVPTAVMSQAATIVEGGATTIGFTEATDASEIDTSSLRYFFSTLESSRDAATYADSGNASSQVFRFDDNGVFIVYGRIIDKDGGYSDYETTVSVSNVAPTAIITAPMTILEGGSAVIGLTGADDSIVDAGLLRYFFSTSKVLRDASNYVGSDAAASQLFNFNDNGIFVVYGRVLDKDGSYSDYETTVTASNVAPSAVLTAPNSVLEGSATNVSLNGGADASTVDANSLRYFFSTVKALRDAATYLGSSSSASLGLTFNDNGAYVVYGRVIDKDGGFSDYQTTIVVNNVAPTAVINAPATSLEGSLVTVTLAGTDVSSVDAGALRYFLGTTAAARNSATYATSSSTNSQSIRYTDNGTYTIYMRVMDKDGGSTDYQHSIVVQNVAPTATINPSETITEGSSAIVSLTGALDVSNAETASLRYFFSMNAAVRNSATYATSSAANYVELPFNDNGLFVVYARVVDKDGGYSDFQTAVNVTNVAPTPTISSISNPVRTGAAISLVGNATDPAGVNDTLSYIWRVFRPNNATAVFSGTGSNFSFTPTQEDTYRIELTVTDDDGGAKSISTSLAVGASANSKPSLILSPPSESVFFTTTTVQLSATDPDLADQTGVFTYSIQWGDGTSSVVTGGANVAVSHQYVTVSPTGVFTISATVTDGRGLVSSAASGSLIVQGWAVLPDPLSNVSGKALLVVVGGQSGDILEVRDQAGDFLNVKVNNRIDSVKYRNTPVGDVNRILVFAHGGNDVVKLATALTLDATIWGGVGNDTINSGAGNDVVFGDEGDDTIFGGEGRDVLIGGLGSDRISGEGNEDLLIAGYTLYDNSYNHTAPLSFEQRRRAIEAISAEWASSLNQAQRKANLLGNPVGTTWNDRKNGYAFLRSNLTGSSNNTVFDDQSIDYLTGGAGVDWFFANIDLEGATVADVLLDRLNTETQQDIDRWS